MIKEHTLSHMTWHSPIRPLPLVGIHTYTPINNTRHSHRLSPPLCLLLSYTGGCFSLSLSLLRLCFSLCKFSRISPLSNLFCFWNLHILYQRRMIFRLNAILIDNFGAFTCFFTGKIRWVESANAWSNGKFRQWWLLSVTELRRQ